MDKKEITWITLFGCLPLIPVFLLASMLLFAIFVPTKALVRLPGDEYNLTSVPFPYTDTKLPENYVPVEERGLRLYLPDDMTETGHIQGTVIFSGKNESASKKLQTQVMFRDVASNFDHQRIKPEYLEEGIWAYHRSAPETEYELWDFILNLTEDDYDSKWPKFRPKDARASSLYTVSMGIKRDIWHGKTRICSEPENGNYLTKEIYSFENETAKGFLILRETQETAPKKYALYLWLYDRNDLNRSCGALLFSEDMQTLHQIANSAQIVQEQENEKI